MHFKIDEKNYEVKAVTPLDFLNDPEGLTVSPILEEKEKTRADVMREEAGDMRRPQNDLEKEQRRITRFLKHSVKNLSDDEPLENLYKLLAVTLNLSCKICNKIIKMSSVRARAIDEQAHRYSKPPIEILCPSGSYTDMDAYFINNYIYSKWLTPENAKIEKRNREIAIINAKRARK